MVCMSEYTVHHKLHWPSTAVADCRAGPGNAALRVVHAHTDSDLSLSRLAPICLVLNCWSMSVHAHTLLQKA